MRTLSVLALVGLLCLSAASNQDFGSKKPFQQKDTEYRFTYNAQIASGLIAGSEEDAQDPQQKAVTRIQCQARIQFASEQHGQLQLQQCRVGQQNAQMSEPERVQPMSAFEQKNIPSEKQQQLHKACQFSIIDGAIKQVQFQSNEESWSKNLKRAVLNMIQMNLKRNNVQGLRSTDDQGDDDVEQSNQQQTQKTNQGKTFTIPEITLEGACQTTYTINKAGNPQQYNVTKTINFKKCQQIADVAYGYQTQQQQPHCAQCQQYWAQQHGGPAKQNGQSTQQQQQQQVPQQNSEQHPCAMCDPKEVKEQELDRSTVIRCQIHGQPMQKYALERCELLSQYVYRNAKSENGKYGCAMQTVVAATLQAHGAQQANNAQQQIPSMSSSNEESLMYSNDWEVDVKRFYMFGDDEFNGRDRNAPFHQVPNVQQAEQALRKLVQAMQEDKHKGIEAQAPQQLQRLVEMLRMSTQAELKRIEQQTMNSENAQQKQQTKQIMADALAMCGTRNCVAELVQWIRNNQVTSQTKAVQALLTLNQLPAPSDAIVKQVEQLCKSEQVSQQKAVKQACWLTFGALVHELCQHKTLKNAQKCAVTYGAKCSQSGFTEQDQCPMDKKQEYKEAMLSVYRDSKDCIYEKMVALGALGNAGLDNAIDDLERIIKNPSEAPVVRVKAIDALRRLRTQQSRKIQRILLPLFQNTREQPQVRTAAFAIIMYTQPEPQLVDQLAFAIGNEPNKQVQSFAYRTMKMMARSKSQNARQIAKHIKSALKVANVDEQQLRASGKWQSAALYSTDQQEGVFVTFATTISQRSALPVYAHAQLDTQANDQFQINQVKLYMMQQEAEQWYHNVASQYAKQFGQTTRGQRQNWQQQNQQSLRNIFQTLGIKSRRSYSQQQDDNIEFGQYTEQNSRPFAMLCIRTQDVDQGFLALDEHTMSEQTRQMLNGQQKPSLAHLLGMHQKQQQLNGAMASSLQEKEVNIPTSSGVPLRVLNSVPVLAQIEGQAEMNSQSKLGFQLDINAKASGCLAHIQKMESWTPFCASGVQSVRTLTINAPLQGELKADPSQGISIKVKLPQQKTQLASAHTLPITYTATVDPRTELIREPKHIRAIHNPKLERQQREVDTIQSTSKTFGLPLHIQGHYHWPAQPTNYKQYVQLLMATENAVRVSYQPSSESPREVIFSASGAHFQKSSQLEQPNEELRNFYSQKFDSPYACSQDQCSEGDCDQCSEFEQQQQQDAQEMYSQQHRQQQLQQFISQYSGNSGSNQYKHSLKLIAQTKGGRRDVKAQASIQALCDAYFHFCNMDVKADRTQTGTEGQSWTLQAHAQFVMPQRASSAAQLQQQQQHQQFIGQAHAQWGLQGQQKQQVTIRVQGTQAHSEQVRNILQQQQSNKQLISTQQLRNFQRRSAFLNKFQLQADYQLKAPAQNAINRALELLKSAYFWNTRSQLIGYGAQQKGKVSASIVIDPITQQHANVTIKTPSQQVRLQQIELPTSVRPFPLIRQQSAQQTHSLAQLFQQATVSGRVQCKVDGRNVDTFDDSEFRAPLSSVCYTVLAKDCGSEEPQFVVLMKKLPQQQGRSAQNAQKKLKVITPQEEIECEPKQQQNSQRLSCKVNGQQVNGNQQEDSVQYNNAQQSDVTIQAEGIAVRFNGRKAWLKVSGAYKNTQCGLCGHYDDSDDQQDEWRMANGQITSNLVDFHRSYTLKDQELCSEQQLNGFYSEKYNNDDEQSDSYFKQYNNNNDSDEDSDEDEEDTESQDQDWQKEQFDGQFDSSEENDDDDEEDDDKFDVQNIFGIGGNTKQQCCCCCEEDDEQCQSSCKSSRKCRKQCARNQCPNGKQQNQQQQKQCCCCCDSGDDQCTQQCVKSSQCEKQCDKGQCQWGRQVSPVWKTMVTEQQHAVCFSTQPVKQCPRGTVPDNNDDDDDQQDNKQEKSKKVRFVCLERGEPETRRLLRQLRNGKRVVDVTDQGASFTEKVREPQQCQRGRY